MENSDESIELGEFSDSETQEVLNWNKQLNHGDILVTVSGGVVTSVRTRTGAERHVIIDYDDLESHAISAALEKLTNAVWKVTEHA